MSFFFFSCYPGRSNKRKSGEIRPLVKKINIYIKLYVDKTASSLSLTNIRHNSKQRLARVDHLLTYSRVFFLKNLRNCLVSVLSPTLRSRCPIVYNSRSLARRSRTSGAWASLPNSMISRPSPFSGWQKLQGRRDKQGNHLMSVCG